MENKTISDNEIYVPFPYANENTQSCKNYNK